MAAIVLEPVNPQEPAEAEEVTEDPPAEPEAQEETAPEPVEEEPPEPPAPEPPAPEPPAPKKRGRPPKAKAEAKAPAKAPGLPKAKPAPKPRARKPPPPPESESDSSSDVEETLKNVYRHVEKPSMETALLQFLVNRKQSEQTRRRELWSQLAKF